MNRSSDAVTDLIGFAHRLRAGGLVIDPARVANALRALGAYGPRGADDVYWATRLTLCSRHDDLRTFDRVYREWFGTPAPMVTVVRSRPQPALGDEPAVDGADVIAGTDGAQVVVQAGLAEQLGTRSRRLLSAADLTETATFIEAMTRSVPLRRTMLRVPGGRSSLDVSRTARSMLQHGCEPVRLWYQQRNSVRRRLVLLLDVSHSVREHRNRLLRFAYAAVAVAPGTTEVFTIGTRLERITPELRVRNPQTAMDALADRHSDWDGGTRLEASVTTFVRRWGGHRVVRAANVVLVSDGWELADPAPLVAQVARLSRLAHRVIWATPDIDKVSSAPVAPALVDSRRYVHLAAAHDAAALRSLAGLVGCTPCGTRCTRHRQLSLGSTKS
ncbi:VWA domain-containing protein [Micromonospora sp. NPDC002389]|uniref:vWA domain-containing protein n=1 Tax=Micromonospora sp. NPDC002389 TaxID=3154272 RepID=UPI00331E5E5C